MVVIGAITRLTESGLSMVEWRPLIGALPPMSTAEWERVFELYQQTPEYQKKNFWMGMEDFKTIFFWEWLHRFWGRLIGLVYALPLVYFWARGMIPAGYKKPLMALLLLGAAQGLMGWYMVQSGLVDVPAVSHYRLAAHLGLAFLIFALLVWVGLGMLQNRGSQIRNAALRFHFLAMLGLYVLTVFWGAYVAGLDAGLVYNESFPLMGGQVIPPDINQYSPFWVNFLETHSGVQFVHRWLGMALAVMVLAYGFCAMRAGVRLGTVPALVAMVLVQAGLGIATLLSQVWLPLATLHQAGALFFLFLLVMHWHGLRVSRR